MLDMSENRVEYIESLYPSDGFHLAFAVGTTYTLDLSALLGVCMALSEHGYVDDPLRVNKVELFASVARVRDKIAVFCDKGHIKNDNYSNPLCILLEGMINQVVLRRPNQSDKMGMASFHAKTWIIDYENDDHVHEYRLIVLSRNLTFDGSWDLAVHISAYSISSHCYKNSPVRG